VTTFDTILVFLIGLSLALWHQLIFVIYAFYYFFAFFFLYVQLLFFFHVSFMALAPIYNKSWIIIK